MEFYKNFVLSVCLMFLSGCVIISGHHKKKVYEQGYNNGVQQEMNQAELEFQGGNFPYYHWASPIVQEVKVPAHLANGLMIPEHTELVIIKPGEWVISPAYPIESQKEDNDCL